MANERASSIRTVVIAFVSNLLVAIAKSVAAAVTGSASMLAEAAHSWADAGNEIFLLIADLRSVRPPDESHPLGYGREAYIWSLFAAVGVFTAGAVVSVQHGIQELFTPDPTTNFGIAYLVLGISVLVEGFSFVQSLVQARRRAAQYRRTTFDYALNGSDATLRAVLAEDAAALVGLAIAFSGIVLHQITGVSAYDAIGSILIGALLAVVAVILISRNRTYLIGSQPPAAVRTRTGKSLLAHAEIARVTYLHLEFLGPGKVFVVAAVDLVGDRPESNVAEVLRRIEHEIEENELVQEAVLTLSVNDEPSIDF